MNSPLDDRDDSLTQLLARKASTGQLARFDALCEHTLPALQAWVALRLKRGLRDKLDVDEIVDECWLRAVQRFDSYDSAVAHFRVWMFGFAKNILRERLRELSQGALVRSSIMSAAIDDATSLTRRVARRDAVARFLERVEELGEEERELVELFGLEGLSAAEVGLRLGIKADAAQKRWQRLREELVERKFPRELLSDT